MAIDSDADNSRHDNEALEGRLLVVQADERCFAVVRDAERLLAVEDLDHDRRLGTLRGELTSFPVDSSHVLFAGAQHLERLDRVVIEQPPVPPETCRVKNHVWLSVPRPFLHGMQVTVSWRDEHGAELGRRTTAVPVPPVHGSD